MVDTTKRTDYTFKYNKNLRRHGWLRLTPAYSVKLVQELIKDIEDNSLILDPFSGTGTTGLVASEKGLKAHMLDINPFLVWFGKTKCSNYRVEELDKLRSQGIKIIENCEEFIDNDNWLPPIFNITRWWDISTLKILSAIRKALVVNYGEPKNDTSSSLLWVAFCRLIIETSSASFNHVSMSFNDEITKYNLEQVKELFVDILDMILESASVPLDGEVELYESNSLYIKNNGNIKYTHVVTSPPYPNRISYIRELRPYMYWTKFLTDAKSAGELDWKAIGGTWGIATSRLDDWMPEADELPKELYEICSMISKADNKHSKQMSIYIHKYFHDMYLHLANLRNVLSRNAKITYVVGNSTFYDVHVPTDELLKTILTKLGYHDVNTVIVRKRNSKKELFEYCVSATWNNF